MLFLFGSLNLIIQSMEKVPFRLILLHFQRSFHIYIFERLRKMSILGSCQNGDVITKMCVYEFQDKVAGAQKPIGWLKKVTLKS